MQHVFHEGKLLKATLSGQLISYFKSITCIIAGNGFNSHLSLVKGMSSTQVMYFRVKLYTKAICAFGVMRNWLGILV